VKRKLIYYGQYTKEGDNIRNKQFEIRDDNGNIMKIFKYKIKKIHVTNSEITLLKSKITCGVLNNTTSHFAVVMGVGLRKAINPIVTRDIKIP
jgi:hypothetical protein